MRFMKGLSTFDMSKHDHDEEFHVGVNSMGSGKGQVKCQKCGSKKHGTESCDTDFSKVTCFRCGLKGHVSFNCKVKQSNGKSKGGKDSKSNVVSICFQVGCHRVRKSLERSSTMERYSFSVLLRSQSK